MTIYVKRTFWSLGNENKLLYKYNIYARSLYENDLQNTERIVAKLFNKLQQN
jgi:hypothetical protein